MRIWVERGHRVFWGGLLLALVACGGLPAGRRTAYGDVVAWLDAHALPAERLAVQRPAQLARFTSRALVPLPEGDAFAVLAALQAAQPDYCLAWRDTVWDGVRAQPWFEEHYRQLHAWGDPYDAAFPLTLFGFTPAPFDEGRVIPLDAAVATPGGGELRLRQVQVSASRLTPGELLYLTLRWETVRPVELPLRIVVALTSLDGQHLWAQVEHPTPAGISTDIWTAGMVLDDRYALLPPLSLPEGTYRVTATVFLPGGQPLSVPLTLATLARPPAVSTEPPAPDVSLDVMVGDAIRLVGYDGPVRVAPGDNLRLALYWHALADVEGDHKVFVHLLGSAAVPLAQDDGKPVAWTYPTTVWQPGDYVRDEHVLTLSPATPRGDFWLAVGMYDLATGERLPVRDASGDLPDRQLLLYPLEVR